MSGKNKIFPIKFEWRQGILKNLSGVLISAPISTRYFTTSQYSYKAAL